MSHNDCTLLDGSAVYGRNRPDGWLDVMRRYVCPCHLMIWSPAPSC